MTLVPVMWIVWAVLVLILAAIYLYRSRLTRDEEDQLFLDDSFSQVKTEQAAIVAKVARIQPILRVSQVLAGLATVFVLVYYAMDIIHQLS